MAAGVTSGSDASRPGATLSPVMAWAGASLASALCGATLFIGLVLANGLAEWPLLAQIWLGLMLAGLVIALIGGGAVAMLATAAASKLRPPRPAADMALGAFGALGFLMAVRAWVFSRMEAPLGGLEPGLVLLIPLIAGAVAGFTYWRLAGRP
jgi:hypothetical protein